MFDNRPIGIVIILTVNCFSVVVNDAHYDKLAEVWRYDMTCYCYYVCIPIDEHIEHDVYAITRLLQYIFLKP